MQYRIIEKANGVFIPQVKSFFSFYWKHLNLWLIEAERTQFNTFTEALETIEKYKIQLKQEKTINYFKIK